MERFIIEGGRRLSGTITPAGNKNAALPLLAATLLTDQNIRAAQSSAHCDVTTKIALLQQLGAQIQPHGEHSWRFVALVSALFSRMPRSRV